MEVSSEKKGYTDIPYISVSPINTQVSIQVLSSRNGSSQ